MQVSAAKLRLFVKETSDSVGALSERKFYWHIGCDGMVLFDSVSSFKFVQNEVFFLFDIPIGMSNCLCS